MLHRTRHRPTIDHVYQALIELIDPMKFIETTG